MGTALESIVMVRAWSVDKASRHIYCSKEGWGGAVLQMLHAK